MVARRTWPYFSRSALMRLTTDDGMANPRPIFPPEGENISVLTPINSPELFSKGPPELPGFSPASVWMMSSKILPLGALMVRPSELMIPAVRVLCRRNGFPMARTFCPTFRLPLSPILTG